MEQLDKIRGIPVARLNGMPTRAAQEPPKPATALYRRASCPSFCTAGPREVLPIPCQYLPRTQSVILCDEANHEHGQHYAAAQYKVSQNYYRSYCTPVGPCAAPAAQSTAQMLQQLGNVCACPCPCPCPCPCSCPGPCKCGCCLPAPCNTPPRCIQYMTGYYYYPYGFWFCGPYHVTGTCVPGGPVSPGGPCQPCAPNPGGPCGPCNPCCVCGIFNACGLVPALEASSAKEPPAPGELPDLSKLPAVDISKALPTSMNGLVMGCIALNAPCKACRPCGPCP
ncbi:hypothetical protein B5X24_HaOG213924 [Helicoverpa armigera]|uniref:Uncharacterized protein n=1 Tax=Helicoverpa armigera TaxID=29058 RepID=A0A2W1B3Z2_HELAM|nr:hypothetical protein B5X24_HaOG213924 [Helicoverpa armigera]